MTEEYDMSKKAEFDENFSFASKNLNNTDIQNNNYLLIQQNMKNIDSGKPLNSGDNCEKENKLIKEQSEQTLSLLNIINLYQNEHQKYIKQQHLYSITCKKSDDLKRLINIITMIFILILIITMLYIHKHRIVT